jgi:hypothetical protein
MSHPKIFALVAFGFLAWHVATQPALAQSGQPSVVPNILDPAQYEEWRDYNGVPIVENRQRKSRVGLLINGNGKFENQTQKDEVEQEFLCRVAEMTWTDRLPRLTKLRKDIKRDLGLAGRADKESKEIHVFLNAKVFEFAKYLVENDKFHPASRYNAMIVIGYIDQTEGDIVGKGAIPLKGTLDYLRNVLDPTGGEKYPEILRIGAMCGIARHAELAMSPTDTANMIRTMTSIVGADQPLPNTSPTGHAWLRHRGAQVLGALAETSPNGDKPESVAAIEQLAADAKGNTILTRCDAIKQFGTFTKNSFPAKDVSKILRTIAESAIEASKLGQDAESLRVTPETMRYLLTTLKMGLRGYIVTTEVLNPIKVGSDANHGVQSAALASSDSKQMATELGERLDKMLELGTRLADDAYMQQISKQGEALEEWLKSKAAGNAVTAR